MPHLKPLTLDQGNALAIEIWNDMGGIDWQALPVLAELRGVRSFELLLDALLVIQDRERRRAAA